MNVGKFGLETFYVNSEKGIYTPSDLSFEYGKSVEYQSQGGAKPKTLFKEANLIKTGFKLHLDCRFVNVKDKIKVWQSMAESKKSYVYSIGGELVSTNKFIVTSAKSSNIKRNTSGVYLSADLDISIEEYTGKTETLDLKQLEEYE